MLKKLLINTIVIIAAGAVMPGIFVDGLISALVLGVVLIVLNTLLKPILVFFTLPATILTMGIFLFVINIFIIFLADLMVSGFAVDNWVWALIFSLTLSIVSGIFEPEAEEKD